MTQRQQTETAREGLVSHTFLQLADTLVDDFDIIDLLTILADRCLELVDADAAGILLVDTDGNLPRDGSLQRTSTTARAVPTPERGRPVSGGLLIGTSRDQHRHCEMHSSNGRASPRTPWAPGSNPPTHSRSDCAAP